MNKKFPAMASVEFSSVAVGMQATDALLKKAPISLVRCGTIGKGRYLTVIGGSTGSVDEALREAIAWGGDSIVDHVFLPDVHPRLHDAILGKRQAATEGALGVVETPTVSCLIAATERALKGTPVDLVEIRLGDPQMDGRGLTVLQGALHDLEAAVELAVGYLKARRVSPVSRILTSPHEGIIDQIDVSTSFDSAHNFEMEGEHGT